MRAGSVAAAAVLAAVALAPGAARAEHYEPPAEFELRSCSEHVGSLLVPREPMKRYLAPGFGFGYFPAELAALDPGERLATLLVISVRCAERLVDGVATEPQADGLAVLVVEPPATLARPGADFHAVGVRSMFDRGEVTHREPLGTLGGVRAGADTMRDDPVAMRLLTVAGGEVAAAPGRWRLFRTERGTVLDASDVDAGEAVDTQPGSATLLVRGIPGLPPVASGFGIHEWDVDVSVRPVTLP